MMKQKDINTLVRQNILQLAPYSSARHEFEGIADIFLDANENAFDSTAGNFNRYPDPLQLALKARLAAIKNIAAGSIFLGNGSDEVIDLAIRIFCEPGKHNIIICPPTYGMYAVSAAINNVETIRVPLGNDFYLNSREVLQAVNKNTRMIFICSPNNPTGNSVPQQSILELLQGFDGIVVIDEAYIDYSAQASYLSLLPQYPNLIILQTLSKAWALAALRIGIGYASEEVIAYFNKVKPPYNINAASQQLALQALQHTEQVNNWIRQTIAERTKLTDLLNDLPFVEHIYPGDANFLLVKCTNADALYRWLLNHGIVVRNRSKEPGCENCLRISIGTAAENIQLLNALKEYNDSQ